MLYTDTEQAAGSSLHCGVWAMIDQWSHESRGADRNVVDIVGRPRLAEENHSGPGGVSENFAEGWGRFVQAGGAPRTRVCS